MTMNELIQVQVKHYRHSTTAAGAGGTLHRRTTTVVGACGA